MSTVNLNPDQTAALRAAEPGTQLLADDGSPVGVFLPARMAGEVQRFLDERRRRYEAAFNSVTVEELQAIEAMDGGIPHEEAMKRWGLG